VAPGPKEVAGQAWLAKVALGAGVAGGLRVAGLIRAEMQGDLRLVRMTASPANLLSPALCAALMAALGDGLADPHTRAILLLSGLTGPGQGFSGGMDLADMAAPWPAGQPAVADVTRLLQAAEKPVIAVLHGTCLGAAAEIALAARARLAAPDLRFGLRDALVGLLPGAGGAVMLARLVGAAPALRLIANAVTITADEALALGLVNRVTTDDPVAAAVALAGDLAAGTIAPPDAGLRDGRAYQAAVAAARQTAGGDPLRLALADCVEAAQLLPPDQALAFAAESAAEIATRSAAGALMHLMMAEMRMAAELPGGAPARRIGFWGGGAATLVLPALQAGCEVVFADDDRAALLAGVERVALAQEAAVTAGQVSPAAREAEWARLHPGVAATAMAGLDLVIAAKPGIDGARVLHLGHWPDQRDDVARLLLVAPGLAELQLPRPIDGFGKMVAATLRRLRLRCAITACPPAKGVARALVRAAQTACGALLAQGLARDCLIAAVKGHMRLALPEDPPGGTTQMTAAQVRARIDAAVVAAGAGLLMQGAVRRAGDLDALAIAALGLPRSAGGPLYAADQRGLMIVRRDLQHWAAAHPVWTPPALLDQLISDGARLSAHVVIRR
jgi:3-hydroxyacyl-CoA dehydrogenase